MYFTPISDITFGFVTKSNSLETFLGKAIWKEVKKAVRSCATFPRGEYGKTAGFRGGKRGTERNEEHRMVGWELIKEGGKTGFKDDLGKKI